MPEISDIRTIRKSGFIMTWFNNNNSNNINYLCHTIDAANARNCPQALDVWTDFFILSLSSFFFSFSPVL